MVAGSEGRGILITTLGWTAAAREERRGIGGLSSINGIRESSKGCWRIRGKPDGARRAAPADPLCREIVDYPLVIY